LEVITWISEFAKANGVGATIPVAIYIIVKVIKEDMKDRSEIVSRNNDAIRALELRIVSMEATLEAIVSKYY